MKANVLIVDDEERMRGILEIALFNWGYNVFTACDGGKALEIVESENIDLILTDLNMPKVTGEELLRAIKKDYPSIPVIIMSAYGTVKSAVNALKSGAFDYILKPFDNDEIKIVLEKALSYSKLESENAYLKNEVQLKYNFENIIGTSSKMLNIFEIIKKVAPKNATVLITGENGTGKELVAKAIHFNSQRKDKPFISVNCASLNENLLESELFGHEKGSFTGAIRSKRGKFEDADLGTLFLDEISETSINFQSKLLRVLQEKEFYKVGGNQTVKVDVRVLAATNKNLHERVEQGLFREDLLYRLNVIPILLPPLRERTEDIKTLAMHFVNLASIENEEGAKTISDEAVAYLESLDWKGNVRELKNTVERAYILSTNKHLDKEDFLFIGDDRPCKKIDDESLSLKCHIDRETKKHIETMLKKAYGKKSAAANMLDIDRTTLFRLMKKYDIS